MTVKFYNLKINPQNRFYNKVAYENNINDTNVIETIELNREIIPNQVFYLKRDNKSDLVKLMGCTYITYEINGTKFGGFITNIQLLAPKGKTIAVQHSVDWWYFTLLNELPFDMHGNCLRAHVNDIDKITKFPTMDFTTTAQESPINDFNIRYKTTDLIEREGIKVNGEITQDFTFLYIFFPQFTENIGNAPILPPGQINVKDLMNFYGIRNKKYPNVGFTCVFLLNLRDGSVCPIFNSDDMGINGSKFYLPKISSSYIATMTLFDGFICDTKNYNIIYEEYGDNNEYARASVNFVASNLSMGYFKTNESILNENVDELSLPIYLTYTKRNNKPIHLANLYLTDNLFNTYYNDEIQIQQFNYNDYLQFGIQKIKYMPYERHLLYNNEINSYKIKNLAPNIATISLVADLSCFVFDYTYIRDLSPILCNNQFVFKPDTINDYWTKLNARLTANSAKQIKLSGAQAITAGIFKIGGGALSAISSGISGGVSTLDDLTNPKKLGSQAVGGAIGGASGVLSGIGGIASGIQGIQSGDLLIKQGEMLSQIANKQLTDGNISMDNNSGAYLYGYRTSGFIVTDIYIEHDKKLETLTDLHRFGYTTFLQLDEIYKNHQREHFNYFQASDIEITGLPLFIASDLQNMFLSGVHLWTRDIEEFENGTNYQLGLWD